VDVNSSDKWFMEEDLVKIIQDYNAVIAGLDFFSERVIERANKLKIIARRGIGFDKIDLVSCRKKGILVTNTPVSQEHQAVAEFTIGLIFDVIRNITPSSQSLKNGSWERAKFLGQGLTDITVGILGLGNIGKRVAKLLTGLGNHVIYTDPYVNDPTYEKVDLQELFRQSDVVTIHVPKTSETVGMVNRDVLSLMKKGSSIVNTARGEVINLTDLIDYVNNGTIKSVALDVFDVEPPNYIDKMRGEHYLTTPHIAAYTSISFEKIDEICYQNVLNALLGTGEIKFLVY
jgi:D-3-phosphoglycerate dehydrogenase